MDHQEANGSNEDLASSSGRDELMARVRNLAPPGGTDHPPALAGLVKIDLERQWQRGRPVSLESYLEAFPELGTSDTVAVDLIFAEYATRCRAGAPMELARFVGRFPRQAEALRRLVQPEDEGGPGTQSLLDHVGEVEAGPGATPPSFAPAAKVSPELPEHFGHYRIIKRLGRGAMGAVYLADDTRLGRQVALKVPHLRTSGSTRAASAHDLDRFYREARAAANLNHPNLCPVYDVGQVEGIPYLTMAYIRGRPLSRYINPDRPIPPRRVAVIVRKLARAMEEAHRSGVIHRDLKPSNIMVGSRRELVIMDFGLVWRIGAEDRRLTRRGLIVGTPAYMSPEQISGRVEDLGPRCDVYSLGVILYELLTARRPFEGPEAVVLAQILYVDPVSPSAYRPELDDQIAAICLKAVAKRSEDRYATMGEFASSLADYLGRGDRPPRLPESAAAPEPEEWAGGDPRDSGEPTAVIPTHPAEIFPFRPAGEFAAAPELEEWANDDSRDSGEPTAVIPSHPAQDLAETEDEFPELPSDEPSGDAIEGSEPAEEPAPATNLWEAWDRWAAIVETIVLCPEKRRLVTLRLYERSYKELIEACREKAATASGEKQNFYRKLEGLVLPWLTPMAIGHTDREILLSLLYQFPEIQQEIEQRSQEPDRTGARGVARSAKVWGATALTIATLLLVWLAWSWAAP